MSGSDSCSDRQVFEEWMTENNRHYVTEDEKEIRFNVFQQTLREIEAHNSVPNQSWRMGLNLFSDMTPEEFQRNFTGLAMDTDTEDEDDHEDEDEDEVIPPAPDGDDVLPEPEPEPVKRQ